MTTLSQIVRRAFRESQILDIDRSPSDAQELEAVTILRGIILRHIRPPVLPIWIGELSQIREQRGEIFRDFTSLSRQCALPQDTYVNLFLDRPTEVLLPPSPGDGSRLVFVDTGGTLATNPLTLRGNGNRVAGSAFQVLSTNNSTASLMFRRDLADWISVNPVSFVNTSTMPFPQEFDDLFVIELAARLNPRYGKDMSPVTMQIYEAIRSRFMGRYMSQNSSISPDTIWRMYAESDGNTGHLY